MVSGMNVFELLQVQADLEHKGHTRYHIAPGNGCVWAQVTDSTTRLDFYYFFQDGQIRNIEID